MVRDHGDAPRETLCGSGRQRYDHYRQMGQDTVTTGMLLVSGMAITVSMGTVMLLGIMCGGDHVYAHRSVVSARIVPVHWP